MCRRFAWSHGTWTRIAIPKGVGSGPVSDQPPPTTVSLPSATCAKSARSIVTFTLRTLAHAVRAPRARASRDQAHSLGSVGQAVSTKRGGPEMFKSLFYAVLGFWLLKKYVMPYFDERRESAAIDET